MEQVLKNLFIISTFSMALIVGYAATRTHEANGWYVDDSITTTKASAALLGDPLSHNAEINVVTRQGNIQLSESVPSKTIANSAQRVAERVEGVESIFNDMRIK